MRFRPKDLQVTALEIFELDGVFRFPPPVGKPFVLPDTRRVRQLVEEGLVQIEEEPTGPYVPALPGNYDKERVMARLEGVFDEPAVFADSSEKDGPITAALKRLHQNQQNFAKQNQNRARKPFPIPTPDPDSYRFVCRVCGKEFAGSRGLAGHLRRKHDIE